MGLGRYQTNDERSRSCLKRRSIGIDQTNDGQISLKCTKINKLLLYIF